MTLISQSMKKTRNRTNCSCWGKSRCRGDGPRNRKQTGRSRLVPLPPAQHPSTGWQSPGEGRCSAPAQHHWPGRREGWDRRCLISGCRCFLPGTLRTRRTLTRVPTRRHVCPSCLQPLGSDMKISGIPTSDKVTRMPPPHCCQCNLIPSFTHSFIHSTDMDWGPATCQTPYQLWM